MVDEIAGIIPKISFASYGNIILWGLGLLVLVGMLALIAWLVIRHIKYKFKVVIFEKVGGKFQATVRDRAMSIPYGLGGDRVFYMRKLKRKEPMPQIQAGRNIYWFFMREDGELINFEPGDFDEQARQMGARFLDKEMRYARVSLQSHFKERFDKPKFWDKYGALIVQVGVILVMMVFLYLIIDKILEYTTTLKAIAEIQSQIQEMNLKVLNAMEQVMGGSGLRQV